MSDLLIATITLVRSVFSMDEIEVLAIVRTLLAYERNYLSIERTQLAQFRTGLTLALIAPPAAATLTYAFDFLSKDHYISMVVYVFLAIITFYGIRMSLYSYIGLKKTRKTKLRIHDRQLELIGKSSTLNSLLLDILSDNKK